MPRKITPRERPPTPTCRLTRGQLYLALSALDQSLPRIKDTEADYAHRTDRPFNAYSDVAAGRALIISRAMLRRLITELEAA